MKAVIIIEGQISGNQTLNGAISGGFWTKTNFYGYKVEFKTKKEAKQALWQAYEHLRREDPEFAKFGIKYSKSGFLKYDASTATIR